MSGVILKEHPESIIDKLWIESIYKFGFQFFCDNVSGYNGG